MFSLDILVSNGHLLKSTAFERNDWMIHPWESILQQLPLIREMKIFLYNKDTKFSVMLQIQ